MDAYALADFNERLYRETAEAEDAAAEAKDLADAIEASRLAAEKYRKVS